MHGQPLVRMSFTLLSAGLVPLVLPLFIVVGWRLCLAKICNYCQATGEIMILIVRGDWISQTGCFFGKLPNGL